VQRQVGRALLGQLPHPEVERAVGEALVAEIGTDLTRFPTAKQLASWAGL
jgi:transposase